MKSSDALRISTKVNPHSRVSSFVDAQDLSEHLLIKTTDDGRMHSRTTACKFSVFFRICLIERLIPSALSSSGDNSINKITSKA